tara:strand:- start:394 stop:657 length:264 start_codon:yes stop_codon:yes gene_type:complete
MGDFISDKSVADNQKEQKHFFQEIDDFFEIQYNNKPNANLPEILENIEIEHITEALERYAGNRTKAANSLGIGRTNLIKKLKKYELL